MEGAACVGHPNPDLWFADTNDFPSRLEASRICAGCPVKAACESFAESSNQQHGSWGDIRCVAPALRDAPPRQPTCRKGHPWTDDSTGWRKRSADGDLVRFCRTCHADRQRERRQKAAS
ncbi:WhiB family transcriptional regulator [Prescottella equi]|nr:WhiB family transcriptional regulator [Prescottella equi]